MFGSESENTGKVKCRAKFSMKVLYLCKHFPGWLKDIT
jgi:hypothetical protein